MKACPFCAEDIQDAAVVCKHCGRNLTANVGAITATITNQDRSLPDYYKQTFAKFDAAGGTSVSAWNWAAFLFGALWYLGKGMLLYAVLMIVAVVATAGFAAIPIWIYAGARGNFDYYKSRRK